MKRHALSRAVRVVRPRTGKNASISTSSNINQGTQEAVNVTATPIRRPAKLAPRRNLHDLW